MNAMIHTGNYVHDVRLILCVIDRYVDLHSKASWFHVSLNCGWHMICIVKRGFSLSNKAIHVVALTPDSSFSAKLIFDPALTQKNLSQHG
jgi:hypothetical protein